MKKRILFNILREISHNPDFLKRKKKIILIGVGVFAGFFLLFSTLVVWLGWKAYEVATNHAPKIETKIDLKNVEQTLKEEKLPQVESLDLAKLGTPECWGQVVALLEPQVWLVQGWRAPIDKVKTKCLMKQETANEWRST